MDWFFNQSGNTLISSIIQLLELPLKCPFSQREHLLSNIFFSTYKPEFILLRKKKIPGHYFESLKCKNKLK